MTGIDTRNGTTTTKGLLSESTSQMVKKCLNIIEEFCKGSCTAVDRASIIGKVTEILTSGKPALSESEGNDILGLCLSIIEQHVQALDSRHHHEFNQTGSNDETGMGDKQCDSPRTGLHTGRKQRSMNVIFLGHPGEPHRSWAI